MDRIDCAAVDLGIECRFAAVMVEPVPLCGEHRIQLALLVLPEILSDALRAEQGASAPRSIPDEESTALTAGARPMDPDDHLDGVHGSVVYFIANGDRVKIGTSTNVRNRVTSLSLRRADVLLLLRGGPILERALHREFAAHRIDSTEWFALAGPVRDYIAAKVTQLQDEQKAEQERAEALRFIAQQSTEPAPMAEIPEPGTDRKPETVPELVLVPSPRMPTYPDATPILAKHRAAWDAFREMGTATVDEFKALHLERHASRESCKTALMTFAAHGGAYSEMDGRSERFHCLVQSAKRKDA